MSNTIATVSIATDNTGGNTHTKLTPMSLSSGFNAAIPVCTSSPRNAPAFLVNQYQYMYELTVSDEASKS